MALSMSRRRRVVLATHKPAKLIIAILQHGGRGVAKAFAVYPAHCIGSLCIQSAAAKQSTVYSYLQRVRVLGDGRRQGA